MDKKAEEKTYQEGVKVIQNYVTDYLVNNYSGIEKIEWQGVGVEWRNSPIFGSSMFGNYVNSNVNVFISKDNYFTMELRLNDRMEYDNDLKKYVTRRSLNSDNMDVLVNAGIYNAIYAYSDNPDVKKLNVSEEEKLALEKIKKSSDGSPKAQVIYNLEIHKLIY